MRPQERHHRGAWPPHRTHLEAPCPACDFPSARPPDGFIAANYVAIIYMTHTCMCSGSSARTAATRTATCTAALAHTTSSLWALVVYVFYSLEHTIIEMIPITRSRGRAKALCFVAGETLLVYFPTPRFRSSVLSSLASSFFAEEF